MAASRRRPYSFGKEVIWLELFSQEAVYTNIIVGKDVRLMKRYPRTLLVLALAVCLLPAPSAGGAETESVTRGAFLNGLYQAYEERMGETVPANAAAWAKGLGVIQGYPGGDLALEESLTRCQMAVMLYRYAVALAPVKTPPADALAGFRDKAPAWAADAVAWAVAGDLWFSGSSACLKAGDAVTAPELETALMALSVGGMPLREDWADGNTAPDVTMTVDAATAGEVRWTLRNSGENWMFFGADSGLYRKVNGGWYLLNPRESVITIGYFLDPGASRQESRAWLGGEAMDLPAGEYRVAKTMTRTASKTDLRGTDVRLWAGFMVMD